VGQPRDANPKSAFGVLEIDGTYRVIRVQYDIEKASRKNYKRWITSNTLFKIIHREVKGYG
jgi:hypothetical protein